VALRSIGLLLAVPGLAPACGDSGHLLGRAGGTAGTVIGDGSIGGVGGVTDALDGRAPADGAGDATVVACSGLGPPVMLPSAAGAACASALTTRRHRFALCVCDSLNLTSPLYTDSFDSSGAVIGVQPPAAIGVDGDLQTTTVIQALGSVYVTGAGGIISPDRLVSLGSLRVSGPTQALSAGIVNIAQDVYAGGDLQGFILLSGTLHIAPGASTAQATIYADSIVREPVSIASPCDCGRNAVDVAGAIGAAMRGNDDASAGFAPDRLATVTTSTLLDIPCGTYALSSIDTHSALVLAVHGRALLAVAGDVMLRAGFTVTLDPGAELDLLVGGRLLTSGSNAIGSMTPARFRIWVAGSQTVVFDDDPNVGALVHAPDAQVTASSGLELSGALFAKTLTAGARVNVHFDQAVFSIGASCGEPTAIAVP
jgi:hypothetical protein